MAFLKRMHSIGVLVVLAYFAVLGPTLADCGQRPTEIKIGLVLDDVLMMNATESDLNEALALVNADNNTLDNITLTMDVVILQPTQYTERLICDLISRGVTAAIAVTRCRNLPSVRSTFKAFNIPLLNIGPEPCPYPDTVTYLNVKKHLASEAQFVRDLLKREGWAKVSLFYDNSFSAGLLNEIQGLLNKVYISTTLIHIEKIRDLEATLRLVYHTHFKETWKYMIAASTANTLKILKKAYVVGMRDKDKAWFVVNPETNESDIEPHLLVLDNIGLVKTVHNEAMMCEHPGVARQVLIRRMAEAYQDLMDEKGWTHQDVTACNGKWALGDELMSYMKTRISPSVDRCDNLTQYELRANMWRGTRMGFVRSSIWNKRQGLVADGDVFPNARMGFNGKKFKVGTLAYSFFQRKNTHPNGTAYYTGLALDIFHIIAESLNFTYYFVEPDDKYWGAPDENGNWNGIIRQLMDGEIDIAAAGHTITQARASVVDFADAYYFEPAIIMLKNPGEGSKLLVYLQPLHRYVWICMLFAMPAMALVLWLFTKYSPFYTNQDASCYPQAVNMQSYFPCFWYMYGSLLTQGGCDMPCSASGRILIKVWWTFVVVMIATYTGNLIAFLTVTKVSLPITNLNDLADQSELGYGTVKGSALWNLLMQSKKGPPQRIWAGMDKHDQPETYAEGKKMVLEGDYVMITERSFYEDEAANNCDLKKVPKQEFFFGSYGIGVPKGSPLKRMFSEQIQRMIETGLMNKITKRWVPRQKCAGLTYSESKPAKLSDTQGAFYVCGFGLICAIVAFVVELAYYYLTERKKVFVPRPSKADSSEDNFRTPVRPFLND